jgi:hypothetical protein
MTARPPETAGRDARTARAELHKVIGSLVACIRADGSFPMDWLAVDRAIDDLLRAVSGGRDPDPAVERAALDVVERLESHGEGCCRLDARDRTAIKRLRAALAAASRGSATTEG